MRKDRGVTEAGNDVARLNTSRTLKTCVDQVVFLFDKTTTMTTKARTQLTACLFLATVLDRILAL